MRTPMKSSFCAVADRIRQIDTVCAESKIESLAFRCNRLKTDHAGQASFHQGIVRLFAEPKRAYVHNLNLRQFLTETFRQALPLDWCEFIPSYAVSHAETIMIQDAEWLKALG